MDSLLLQLGLSSKQIRLYNALLETGPTTPAVLTKVCNLPRPTVYALLGELVEKGFVQEDLMSTKKLFLSTRPDELHAILAPLQAEIAQKEEILEELIPLMKAKQSAQANYTPHITYIPHTRIDGYLRSQTPKWNASIKATSTEYVGFQDYTCTAIFADWIHWYWAQPSTKHVQLRLIANGSEFESKMMTPRFDKRRKILAWEGAGDITFCTWINGDYTILLNTRRRPFYLIEIFDPSYAQSQRQIFEVAWKSAIKS